MTRHPTEILLAARNAFLKSDIAKKYNITDIITYGLAPGLWVKYIKSGEIDVAWGGGPTLFDYLYLQGLLLPLTSEEVLAAIKEIPDTIAGMPMKRVGSDGKIYWVAAAIASFGFTVNHDRLEDYNLAVPKSWRDLASPELGKTLVDYGTPALGIADPTQSTSNTRMYEIILQRYGWEEGWKILTLMAANAEIYSGSSDVRDAVIRGDIAVGITIDFYGYTAKLVNPKCEYIIPEGESIVNGDPIALVNGTKHPEAAQAFIAWVLTEGQKILLNPEINRLPVNRKVFDTPIGKNRTDIYEAYNKTLQTTPIKFNDTLAMQYETVMRWYFRATLIDVNDALKEAWKAILTKYFAGELSPAEFENLVNRLAAPLTFKDPETDKTVVFTLEYAINIQPKFEKDASYRDSLISAWKSAALEKYKSVLQSVSGG
ncbi:MAG: ABC transporter substrate-binding protein [Thermoproteales archaeon]|nr:ABC transporter substrate-binding protein [Thermoproteales archaeon]